MESVLIDNGIVLTFGEPGRVIEDAAVLIRDGIVKAVGPRVEVRSALGADETVRVVDARGAVVTPGLVNAHMHLYSTFACGYTPPLSHNFKEILENLWWRLDRALTLDDVRVSALISAARCLLSGVTTIVDHHASYGAISGSLAVVADAVRTTGLRACLAYEVSDRWGEQAALEAIEENECFLAGLPGRNDADLTGLFGLHASFTLSDPTLRRCVQVANRLGSAGFHVHCAEDIADVEDARGRGFAGAVDRLMAARVLGPKTVAAHCIHVTDAEAAALSETGTIVVVNPQSNMNNAVGVADVEGLLEEGCVVGIGSDGMTTDILDEVRSAIFTRRQESRDPTRMFTEASRAIQVTNPYIASHLFGRTIGVLREGAAGDAVVWDYYPPTPVTDDTIAGHIVFGLPSARPTTVVCSGRVVVRDRHIVGLDIATLAREARLLANALWKRMQ